MRADLHLHTLCSDGAYAPAEIARRALQAGVRLFSLTDHDSLEGSGEGAEAARALGLHFVRGIEVSAYLGATKVHVLGYGCGEGSAYKEFLRARVEGAKLRAADSIAKANAYFSLSVTPEEVERYHVRKEAPLHTMHVVKAFAARLNADMGALYRAAFAPSQPAFSDMGRPSPEEAIRTVHAMGGLAVLAHPAQILVLPPDISARFRLYQEEERAEIVRTFAGAKNALMEELAPSLDGIECFHSTHTAVETEEFLAFAAAHGLFATGGSDFHAEGMRRSVGQPAFDAVHIEERLLALEGSI